MEFYVLNTLGQVLFHKECAALVGINEFSVNVGNLNAGIYHYALQSNSEIYNTMGVLFH